MLAKVLKIRTKYVPLKKINVFTIIKMLSRYHHRDLPTLTIRRLYKKEILDLKWLDLMTFSQLLLCHQFIIHRKKKRCRHPCLLNLLPAGICSRITRLCSQSNPSSLLLGELGGRQATKSKLQSSHTLRTSVVDQKLESRKGVSLQEQKERIRKENECYSRFYRLESLWDQQTMFADYF